MKNIDIFGEAKIGIFDIVANGFKPVKVKCDESIRSQHYQLLELSSQLDELKNTEKIQDETIIKLRKQIDELKGKWETTTYKVCTARDLIATGPKTGEYVEKIITITADRVDSCPGEWLTFYLRGTIVGHFDEYIYFLGDEPPIITK